MNKNIQNEENEEIENDVNIDPRLKWFIIAFLVSIFICFFSSSGPAVEAGFIHKIFSSVIGGILGAFGYFIGNYLRLYIMPNSVYTNGGFLHLLWIRIFWQFGPQTIGLLIGCFIGLGLTL